MKNPHMYSKMQYKAGDLLEHREVLITSHYVVVNVSDRKGEIFCAFLDNPCEFFCWPIQKLRNDKRITIIGTASRPNPKFARDMKDFVFKAGRNLMSMRNTHAKTDNRYEIGAVFQTFFGPIVQIGRNGSRNDWDGLWYFSDQKRIGFMPCVQNIEAESFQECDPNMRERMMRLLAFLLQGVHQTRMKMCR